MSDADRYHNVVTRTFRSGAQVLLLKPFIWSLVHVEVHGGENFETMPTDEAFILVSNHTSHLDAPLLFGGMPQRLATRMATGAAADYFFKHWYLAGITTMFFNAFPVERASQQAETVTERQRHGLAGRLLSSGVPLLIFPEATRSRSGAMGPFKPGSAALAISHVVPVVPAAIVGAHAAWPAETQRWRAGRPPVHIVYGSPMLPLPDETAVGFSDRLHAAVVEMHDTTANAYGMPTQAEMHAIAAVAAQDTRAGKHHRGG